MPDWLLNNVMKIVAAALMTLIASRAENLPEVYKKLKVERKGFYERFDKKLERGFLYRKI